MSEQTGKIGWVDMTVDDAAALRDFYADVVGLRPEPVSMGDYDDFNMTLPGSGEPVCGICHALGGNKDLPGGWLVYFVVEDVDASASACIAKGGKVIVEPRALAGGRFCVIEDPGGATAALYQA